MTPTHIMGVERRHLHYSETAGSGREGMRRVTNPRDDSHKQALHHGLSLNHNRQGRAMNLSHSRRLPCSDKKVSRQPLGS